MASSFFRDVIFVKETQQSACRKQKNSTVDQPELPIFSKVPRKARVGVRALRKEVLVIVVCIILEVESKFPRQSCRIVFLFCRPLKVLVEGKAGGERSIEGVRKEGKARVENV